MYLFARDHSLTAVLLAALDLVLRHTLPHLVLPHARELLPVPPAAHRERLDGHHVVLVRGRVARRRGVCGRVDDAQLRGVCTCKKERVQLVVGEQERGRARVVRVEVDDVAAREVARE